MRKLSILAFVTLDGVMQAPGAPRKTLPVASNTAAGSQATGTISWEALWPSR